MPDIQSYHVDWLVTDETTRSDVTVRICDTRLVEVAAGHSVDAIDLGPVALVDGLVNAHTHLEFSRLQVPIPTTGRFTDWIRSVVAYRRGSPNEIPQAIREGIAESHRAGTTLLGDIATVGWSLSDYQAADCSGVIFQELLGLSPQRVAQQQELASSHVVVKSDATMMGLSPHAPYSTHFDLVTDAVTLAGKTGCPITMHLAETVAELELLAKGTGEFRDLLSDFGIWHDDLFAIPRRPMDYLEILAQAPRSLIVHGNYLDEEELRFIATRPQMTLVYCPRTHAAFGHSEHPWRRMQELGGRVAIGTDSRASNPDLSLFAELQFLAARHQDLSHIELLRVGSTAGRHALVGETAVADPSANFTLIESLKSRINNPERELFGPGNRVCGTMINGNWVWPVSIDG